MNLEMISKLSIIVNENVLSFKIFELKFVDGICPTLIMLNFAHRSVKNSAIVHLAVSTIAVCLHAESKKGECLLSH